MQKAEWYYHGKIVQGIYCPWCDMRRACRIVKDLYLWRGILSCGHVRSTMGLTLPESELTRKGLINAPFKEDPRFTARKKELFAGAMALRDRVLEKRRAREELVGGQSIL